MSLELSAEFEVFAVCLFECVSEGFDLGSVLGLHSGDLGGEGADDVVLAVLVGGGLDSGPVAVVGAGARSAPAAGCCCRGTRGRRRLRVGRLGR
jgi:hypothetical protein